MSLSDARARAEAHPDAHAWREGFAHWRPVRQVDELQGLEQETPGLTLRPPALLADEIDFESDIAPIFEETGPCRFNGRETVGHDFAARGDINPVKV